MQMEGKLDLKSEQEILMNVADMMIEVFNAESTLLRVEKLAGMENKKQSQDVYDAILKTFITDATARMNKSATDALTGFAEGDLLKTMLLGLKRFTKYQPINVKAARRLIASKLIDANKYSLFTGQPLENTELRCGLTTYFVESNGNTLYISSN